MFSVFIFISAFSLTAGFRYFNCTKNGKEVSVHPFYLCDNHPLCDDGLDENECSSCPMKFGFVCGDERSCIQKQLLCDGNPNCGDGSDEERGLCGVGRCSEWERKCFLPQEDRFGCAKLCDGNAECFDALDERFCHGRGNVTTHPCATVCENKNVCVLEDQRCDSRNDCGDFSDEMLTVCVSENSNSSVAHKCQNGVALDSGRICDGYSDCADHSDERDCEKDANATKDWFCAVSFFRPTNNSRLGQVPFHQAIPRRLLCDGVPDCENGHDEIGCGSDNSAIPTILLVVLLFSLICVLIVSCALWRERKKGSLEISATTGAKIKNVTVDQLHKESLMRSGTYEITDC